MTIQLPPDLEMVVNGEALRLGTTPATLVEQALRQHFSQHVPQRLALDEPRDEWERKLRAIARPCGVSLTDEALSSEGLYD